MGAADRQRARRGRLVAVDHLEDQPVRRQAAFRAARHDEADLLGGRPALRAAMRSPSARAARARVKSLTLPLPSVLPKTATIARAVDRTRVEGSRQPRHVVGAAGGKPVEAGLAAHPARPSSIAPEVATAPKTPPCMVTISIAAR